MTKNFVIHEIARELKSLGFNEPCIGIFPTSSDFLMTSLKEGIVVRNSELNNDFAVTAPLLSQAKSWMMENYKFYYNVTPYFDYSSSSIKYNPQVFSTRCLCATMLLPKHFDTDFEAEIYAIKKCIEYIKERSNS